MSRILPYYEGSVTMWFKNLMSYRLTKPLDWDLNELQRQLSDCEFHPCGSQDEPQSAVENSVGFLGLLKIKRHFVYLLLSH